MREAAVHLLETLHDAQRLGAAYDFADPERFRWQYTPGPRGGLPLAEMDQAQRTAAMALLDTALSAHGARTARAIMDLEPVLKSLEAAAGRQDTERRNPAHYWFGVFGDPAGDEPWAWRVGGHHLCVHATMVGEALATTPLFFGANPARVPHGQQAGHRVLAAEEDLARALLGTLDPDRLAETVVWDEAPSDIVTGNAVRAEITAVPVGIGRRDLDGTQREALDRLLDHYLARFADPPRVDRGDLTFAWAGSREPGRGHYYAMRSKSFLVEYDNTQNQANHIHTVVRDQDGDWGEDLLAEHYATSH